MSAAFSVAAAAEAAPAAASQPVSAVLVYWPGIIGLTCGGLIKWENLSISFGPGEKQSLLTSACDVSNVRTTLKLCS